MLNDLLFRLRALFRRRAVEAELDEELRFHFENEVEKHKSRGITPEEARRRARLHLAATTKSRKTAAKRTAQVFLNHACMIYATLFASWARTPASHHCCADTFSRCWSERDYL